MLSAYPLSLLIRCITPFEKDTVRLILERFLNPFWRRVWAHTSSVCTIFYHARRMITACVDLPRTAVRMARRAQDPDPVNLWFSSSCSGLMQSPSLLLQYYCSRCRLFHSWSSTSRVDNRERGVAMHAVVIAVRPVLCEIPQSFCHILLFPLPEQAGLAHLCASSYRSRSCALFQEVSGRNTIMGCTAQCWDIEEVHCHH